MVKIAGGKKLGTIRAAKTATKKRSGTFTQGIPKEGITVRFLTEPDQWYGYQEHWDPGIKRYYPHIEGDCPGCEQELKMAKKFLANAVNVSDDRVIPLKLGADIANRTFIKYEKYGTLLDRDYEFTRYGENLDTTYDVSPEAPTKVRIDKYALLDLQEVAEKSFDDAFSDGSDGDEETKPRSPFKKTAKKAVKTIRRPGVVKGVTSKKVAPSKAVAKKVIGKKAVAKAAPVKKAGAVKAGTKRFVRR